MDKKIEEPEYIYKAKSKNIGGPYIYFEYRLNRYKSFKLFGHLFWKFDLCIDKFNSETELIEFTKLQKIYLS